jgi:hypothetical protein
MDIVVDCTRLDILLHGKINRKEYGAKTTEVTGF